MLLPVLLSLCQPQPSHNCYATRLAAVLLMLKIHTNTSATTMSMAR